MKPGVGLLVAGVLALSASCGTSGTSDGNEDGGSGGRPAAGAPASGKGGSTAGSGPAAAGMGGSGAGNGPQAGTAGGGNAMSSAGAGGRAGAPSNSAGAGGTVEPAGGRGAGDAGEAGASGSGNSTGALTLFVMFDRSWSMNECGDGNLSELNGTELSCPTLSRWDLASAALVQFFQDPAAAGLDVALRFFPDDRPTPGCVGYPSAEPDPLRPGENCDPAACAEPLVAAAPLSAEPAPVDLQEAALVQAVMESAPPGPENPDPNPQTPTYPALRGAAAWAIEHRVAHPEEPTAVVLITDGEPTGCDPSIQSIADIAEGALANAGVLTYVVGLTGSSESSLDQIARAGGTEAAFFVSDGDTAVKDLFDALSAIRGASP